MKLQKTNALFRNNADSAKNFSISGNITCRIRNVKNLILATTLFLSMLYKFQSLVWALNFCMILFQFNNMFSHKKVYQYTNTVLKDYVVNTVFNAAIPAYFGQKKCATSALRTLRHTPKFKSLIYIGKWQRRRDLSPRHADYDNVFMNWQMLMAASKPFEIFQEVFQKYPEHRQ